MMDQNIFKTIDLILLMRWRKPRIVYPEYSALGSEKYPCVGKLISICLTLSTISVPFLSMEGK